MATLYEITEALEPGQYLAWVAESSFNDVDRVYSKRVTDIDEIDSGLRVEAEGLHGGRYRYLVHRDGSSEAFFNNPNKDEPVPQGPVLYAEPTNSRELITVKEGYFRKSW